MLTNPFGQGRCIDLCSLVKQSLGFQMDRYAFGRNSLLAGCFLLPTSGYIGPILILFACICGSSLQGVKALLAKKMYPLYLLVVFIIVSSLTSHFGLESCAGIFNWLLLCGFLVFVYLLQG